MNFEFNHHIVYATSFAHKMAEVEFKVIEGIKIYTGTTRAIREKCEKSIKYFKVLNSGKKRILYKPQPSTLTAQGLMSNISFDEKDIIDILSEPTGQIMLIGCNFGEKYNVDYKAPEIVKKSGRGRKPKPKVEKKRRSQGNGKYFSSQVTFVIKHPDSAVNYKIKLFRNGVFQVPGVKDPSMSDLVKPIMILKDYLAYNFGEDVQVMNFMAVMRNYKAKLYNQELRVDLTYLEDIINYNKNYKLFEPYLKHYIKPFRPHAQAKLMKFIGKTNLLNIAEINYNTDKCFCLNIKFYRPMPFDQKKKTTVKLLKKGKINFDGGNSELEMLELYYWLTYIYTIFENEILIDTRQIKNEYNTKKMLTVDVNDAVYSDQDEQDMSD
jgi:hypothetical protein